MEVSTQDLIYVIGEQTVRIKLLEGEVVQLRQELEAEQAKGEPTEVPEDTNEQESSHHDWRS